MSFTRRQFFVVAAGAGGVAFGAAHGLKDRFRAHTRSAYALGAETALTVWHDDRDTSEAALEEAFRAIDRVEDIMSLYRPQSQLCRLNRDGILKAPHPDLVEVLRAAQSLSARSAGAFDVTVQPLWSARQRRQDREESRRLLQRVDWQELQVSSEVIRFGVPGMQATLNGIAQGFAADRVTGVLTRFGIRHALIDTGEIASLGHREGEEPWRVGVQHPREAQAYLCLTGLSDRCMATSGDYATTLDRDYDEHHLIDPKTGRSPRELSSVSVAANTAMEADALSTAAFVLGLEEGMALVASTPGADALMVRKSDGEVFASEAFPRMQSSAISRL